MKKLIKLLLLFIALSNTGNAQSITTSAYNCSGTFSCSLSGTVVGATSYSWTIAPSGSIAAFSNGFYATMNTSVTGLYTVTCLPYNGGTPMLSAIMSTIVSTNLVPNVSISSSAPSNTICSGTSVTLTANGPSSFTWNPGAVNSNSIVVSPTVNSTYTVWGGTSPCITQTILNMTVINSNPVVGILQSGNGLTLCNGTVNLVAIGASTYSWSNGPTSSSNLVNANGCYTVTGFNSCGSGTAQVCVTGSATSGIPLSILGGTGNVCAGANLTLTVPPSVAGSYTNFTWNYGSSSQTGTSIVVSPSVSTCFSVSANTGQCYAASASICTTVTSLPSSLTFPSGNFTACTTATNNLFCTSTAPGSTYNWVWASGSSTNSAITATSVGCYTLTQSNACGSSSSQVCVTAVAPTPTVTLSGYNNVICANSPQVWVASGATSYSWYGIVNSNVVSVGSSSVAFTPTAPGTVCFTLTANNGGCLQYQTYCTTVSAPVTSLTVTGPLSYCSSGNITGSLSASGAQSYTWSTGSTSPVITYSINSNTCFSLTGTTACGNTLSATRCITITPSPTITVAGNGTVCNGANTFTASGATSYTWINTSNYNFLGSGPVVNVNSNISCFTIYGYNGSCPGSTTICPTLAQAPSLSVVATTSNICAGGSVTLTAFGAQSYTWSNGTVSQSVVVTPTASTCYTVIGSNAAGCTGFASQCILVTPAPGQGMPVNVNMCAGASVILTAAPAASYSWNTGATSQAISVNPLVSTCYTVTGYNLSGCGGSTVHCVNVLPNQNLSITGSNTVCLGSSLTFTANGALVYNWSTGAMSNTMNILPTSNTMVSVSSTFTNGCVSTATLSIAVNNSCSDVWPGDANSDGTVSSSDVLELGLAASSTGPSRTPGGNSWTAQFANNWTGTISTGKNKAHADCNGDGTVNSNDTLAIFNNFSLNHSFRPGKPGSNVDMNLQSDYSEAFVNTWNTVDVVLGNAITPSYQMTGISFDLSFESSMLYPDSAYLLFTNSAVNGGSPITFRKKDFGPGYIYSAIVRTDLTDVVCSGKIASLKFKVSPLADDNAEFIVTAMNVTAINSNGQSSALTGGQISLNVSRALGVKEQQMAAGFSMYPNPASGQVILSSQSNESLSYSIQDITGRVVMNGTFTSATSLNTSALSSGVYVVVVSNSGTKTQKKLVID